MNYAPKNREKTRFNPGKSKSDFIHNYSKIIDGQITTKRQFSVNHL